MKRILCPMVVSAFAILLPAVHAQEIKDTSEQDPFADLDALFQDDMVESDETDTQGASDEFDFDDLDSLFQDDMLEIVDIEIMDTAPQDDLLTEEGVSWGGRISGNIQSEWSWSNVGTSDFDPLEAQNEALSPSVSSNLYFDARPDSQFRIFGKFKLGTEAADGVGDLTQVINDVALTGDLPEGWTREEDENGDTLIKDADGTVVFTIAAEEEETAEEDPQTGSAPALNLDVFELFSDFNFDEKVFFRFGKHTIKWGVGYFWSPTDVLNLSTIDVEDPTADREGPVSLKAQYPFGIHNAYLYMITNINAKPLEVAIAPKLEFVVGNTEFGVGGYYQQALSPRITFTFSSSVGDVDFFGEGLASIGSEKTFVRLSRKQVADFADPPEDLETVLDTYTMESFPFLSGTIGFRYLEELDNKAGSIAFIGQYYYNGEGYADSSLLEPAYFLLQNAEFNGLTIADEAAQPEGYEDPPALVAGDLFDWGRHYAAATLGWSNIFDTKLGLSVFALANIGDLSGIVSPSMTFSLIDTFNVNVGARFTFGKIGDEYANPSALINGTNDNENTGTTMSVTLSVSMGGGGF